MMLIACASIQNADANMKLEMTSTWTPDVIGIEDDRHFVKTVNEL